MLRYPPGGMGEYMERADRVAEILSVLPAGRLADAFSVYAPGILNRLFFEGQGEISGLLSLPGIHESAAIAARVLWLTNGPAAFGLPFPHGPGTEDGFDLAAAAGLITQPHACIPSSGEDAAWIAEATFPDRSGALDLCRKCIKWELGEVAAGFMPDPVLFSLRAQDVDLSGVFGLADRNCRIRFAEAVADMETAEHDNHTVPGYFARSAAEGLVMQIRDAILSLPHGETGMDSSEFPVWWRCPVRDPSLPPWFPPGLLRFATSVSYSAAAKP
jgi:hypothetical protein